MLINKDFLDSPKKPGAKDGQIGLSDPLYHNPKYLALIIIWKFPIYYKRWLTKLGPILFIEKLEKMIMYKIWKI